MTAPFCLAARRSGSVNSISGSEPETSEFHQQKMNDGRLEVRRHGTHPCSPRRFQSGARARTHAVHTHAVHTHTPQHANTQMKVSFAEREGWRGSPSLPAPSGANKKSFPRGAPMQHLAPRRNPQLSNGHLIALDQDPSLVECISFCRRGRRQRHYCARITKRCTRNIISLHNALSTAPRWSNYLQ